MKFFVIFTFFVVAIVALTEAAPADEEYSTVLDGEVTEAVEVFGSARQRICTAALCRAVCQALGFPRGSCDWRRVCVCRR